LQLNDDDQEVLVMVAESIRCALIVFRIAHIDWLLRICFNPLELYGMKIVWHTFLFGFANAYMVITL